MGYAGLKDCPTSIIEKDGLKYGLIAFSPNNGTLNIHNLKVILKVEESCPLFR